jgi:hypothetical protein
MANGKWQTANAGAEAVAALVWGTGGIAVEVFTQAMRRQGENGLGHRAEAIGLLPRACLRFIRS